MEPEPRAVDGRTEQQIRDRISELRQVLDDLEASPEGQMPRIRIGAEGVRWAQSIEAWRVMEMVADLPSWARDERLPDIVRLACLETFLVHVRSMVEFFGARRPDPRDFAARNVVPGWEPPSGDEADRLNEYWTTASQQVMHFSNARTLQPDGTWTLLLPEDPVIHAMSTDLLAVWDRFAATVADPNIAPPQADLRRFFLGQGHLPAQ